MTNYIFDCERMKYPNTGLYNYCKHLGTHIQKHLDFKKESITYFTPNGRKLICENSRYLAQSSLQKFVMPNLNGYDIWHSTYQNSYYIPFRNKKIKVILTIHDLNFIYDESKTEKKKDKYLKRLQTLINRADALVCVSDYARKDVEFYCDISNKPLVVIHNGTTALEIPTLNENSYKPEKPFLFSLGVVTPSKNFHSLLPLVKQNENMELVIAGRSDNLNYSKYIIDEARKMGIDKSIKILGPVTEAEKSWYMQNCCAFAFPSLTEGFGLPVTEAMSAGKPLFLSNRTALPEIGSNVAFYFPDFTAARMQQTFVEGMKTYQSLQMQECIKKRALDFNWDKAALQYLGVYRSFI